MTITHKLTHVEEIDDLLIEFFKEKPVFKAWLTTYVNQVQDLEDAYWYLYINRWIENAEGLQLDNLGDLVNEERNGLVDVDYRIRLRVRIRLNYSSGTDRDIIESFALLFSDVTPPISLIESFPAGLIVKLNEYIVGSPFVMASVLQDARGGGIDAQLWYHYQDEDESFQTSADAAPVTGSSQGFTGYVITAATSASASIWQSIAWSPTLAMFAAVSSSGTIMTSSDAITWATRTSPSARQWRSVAWSPSLGMFAAVAYDGTAAQQIATSTNGTTWVAQTAPSAQQWTSITWSPELGMFAAVSRDGTLSTQVMTSTNGTSWSIQTAAWTSQWQSITWSPTLGLFVAVAENGTGTQQIMKSANGTLWTLATTAASNQVWTCVTWVPAWGLFVAMAAGASGAQTVMVSSNGANWAHQGTATSLTYVSLVWSSVFGILYAAAGTKIMATYDGLTWFEFETPTVRNWRGAVWSPETSQVVFLSSDGTTAQQVVRFTMHAGGNLTGVVQA